MHGARFGLEHFNGFFGPLRQDNNPVTSNRWVDFYTERRVVPFLRSAVDSGHLPMDLAADVERLVQRLPSVCGPEPQPTLLHGDAQQNNFVTTDTGAVVADVAPHFGHPEIDLALVDYFHPVPDDVFDAYRDIHSIEAGFANAVTSGASSSTSRASQLRPPRLAATHWLASPIRFAATNKMLRRPLRPY